MEYKILAVKWLSSSRGDIGVIAYETDENGQWIATIGTMKNPDNAEYSAQDIAGWGAKLSKEEAHGFFPQLNASKYKTPQPSPQVYPFHFKRVHTKSEQVKKHQKSSD